MGDILFTHKVDVGTGPRVWVILYVGPKTLGALSSSFSCSPYLFWVSSSFTLSTAKVTNLFLSSSATYFVLLVQPSLTANSIANLTQTHPRLCHLPLVFPPCVILWIIFHSFSMFGMPPSRTSLPDYLLQGLDDSIGPLLTTNPIARHMPAL